MRIFLKLGGSLLTDKTQVEATRPDVLARLAAEICQARAARPDLELVLGHGSGSFGHVAAARHGTRHGVAGSAAWAGFAEVGDAAARLNAQVRQALLAAGAPTVSLPPSASAECEAGVIHTLAITPIQAALAAGLIPLVYGDVAFDRRQGGAIISTEEVLSYLAPVLQPAWFLLAGETEGVLDKAGGVIPVITPANLPQVADALGGSRGADVTGGMASKVTTMLALATQLPGLSIRIFSGLTPGNVARALSAPAEAPGTLLRAV